VMRERRAAAAPAQQKPAKQDGCRRRAVTTANRSDQVRASLTRYPVLWYANATQNSAPVPHLVGRRQLHTSRTVCARVRLPQR